MENGIEVYFEDVKYTNLRKLSYFVKKKLNISLLDYMITYQEFKIPKCIFCDADAKYKSGLKFRDTCGSAECISKNSSSRSHTEETKSLIREIRLKFMKENPDKTAWRKSNMSYPEKKIYDWLKNKNEYIFEREKCFFPYFADFAIVNANAVIEVDGSQHLLEDRKKSDDKKDKLIISKGWRVFRISAIEVLENFEDSILKIENFIKSGNIIEKSVYISKLEKSKIESERIKEEKKKKEKEKIENIKLNLLNSNIDFSRFGWVSKASKIIGITPANVGKWMKRNMLEFYNENCFKRN